MKPFDLEKAKAGAQVVQRCGRRARIVDFALKNEAYPLVVIYTDDMGREHLTEFSVEGKYYGDQSDDYRDLFMAPVKREGWVNIYRSAHGGAQDCYPQPLIFNTQEEAIAAAYPSSLRATTRIEWEE